MNLENITLENSVRPYPARATSHHAANLTRPLHHVPCTTWHHCALPKLSHNKRGMFIVAYLLPDPRGPLSDKMPSSSIAAANSQVKALLQGE